MSGKLSWRPKVNSIEDQKRMANAFESRNYMNVAGVYVGRRAEEERQENLDARNKALALNASPRNMLVQDLLTGRTSIDDIPQTSEQQKRYLTAILHLRDFE